ncbi:hypothetical protein Rhal01_01830 [Rubritalea halochordaticola]|uniref:DUF4179 domain-containing protein n=1 Tax=Rubritalea halochordaticola TaxID=714537 RepID=A0ABP9V3J1_9BACT
MSWAKENYEKAAVGGAAVVALAVGAIILFGGDKASKGGGRVPEPNNDASVAAAGRLDSALELRDAGIKIDDIVDPDGRKLGIFVGQRLYVKTGSDQPIDLYSTEEEVHPGIPNRWWIEHNLDPGYANAPERDPDGDGFTNMDEATAKTDPNDAKAHPLPIKKIAADSVEEFKYRMKWSALGGDDISVYYRDIAGTKLSQQVKPGDKFFDKEPMNQRFQLDKKTQVTDDRGMQQDAYEVKDLHPLKQGRTLLLLYRGKAAGENEFSDYSANLRLNALGQQDKTFKLEEGESFSLPYDPKAAVKPYKLKSIKPDGSGSYQLEFEYEEDGQKKTHTIPGKGK